MTDCEFHVNVERPKDDKTVREGIAFEDFNEIKNYIEKKLREFQHSDDCRIVFDMEEINHGK